MRKGMEMPCGGSRRLEAGTKLPRELPSEAQLHHSGCRQSPSPGAESWPEAGPLQGRDQQGHEEGLWRKPILGKLWLAGSWGVGLSKSKGRPV